MAGLAGVCALAAAVLVGVVRSADWAIVHDSSLMFYVARLVDAGAVPYRDVFDFNWPGTHLAHLAFLRAFGESDAAWRGFDLVLLGGTMATAYALVRPDGRAGGALAAALIAAGHLLNGEFDVGQRDVAIAALLLWSAALLATTAGSGGAFVAGLAIGTAATIKPIAATFVVAAVLLPRPGEPGRRLRGLFALAAGAAIPVVAVFAWLAARGGVASFLAITAGFVLPHYGSLGRLPLVAIPIPFFRAQIPLLPAFALAPWGWSRAPGRSAPDPARAVALAFVAYGVFSLFIQGKGWPYHGAPLAIGLAIGAGRGFNLLARGAARARILAAGATAAAALASLPPLLTVVPHEPPAISSLLAEDLAAVTRANDAVQVFDATDGAVDALRRTHRRLATPYFYDFPFFAGAPDDPFVGALRADLLRRLAEDPPVAIVIGNQQWPLPHRGYERFESWQEFMRFLAAKYSTPIQRDLPNGRSYRLYVRSAADR